jgi:hypothetical protein
MPIELEIIRAAEFVRMGTQGQFDLAASCAVAAKLAAACKRRGIDRALVDVRNSIANLNPTELAALVNVFRDIGFSRHQRIAILHAEERSHRPRMFAFISRMKGWEVEAFTKFEDAMCWLSEQEKQKPEVRSPARRVPVSHADAHHPRPVSIKAHPARKIASYARVSSNVEMTASRTS